MQDIAPDIVAIADACLGGLQGRSALIVGPQELRLPYTRLLRQFRMKYIYEENDPQRVTAILPNVQLLISVPRSPLAVVSSTRSFEGSWLTAADIAQGCEGRHTPLLIFDLAPTTSVEELAGLLPAVCLYTPDDLRKVLEKVTARAS